MDTDSNAIARSPKGEGDDAMDVDKEDQEEVEKNQRNREREAIKRKLDMSRAKRRSSAGGAVAAASARRSSRVSGARGPISKFFEVILFWMLIVFCTCQPLKLKLGASDSSLLQRTWLRASGVEGRPRSPPLTRMPLNPVVTGPPRKNPRINPVCLRRKVQHLHPYLQDLLLPLPPVGHLVAGYLLRNSTNLLRQGRDRLSLQPSPKTPEPQLQQVKCHRCRPTPKWDRRRHI